MGVMLGNTHPCFNIDRQNEIIWEGKASKGRVQNKKADNIMNLALKEGGV